MMLCLTLLTVGCVAEPYNQGNYVDASVLKGKEGVWTKKDVEQAIGSASFSDPKDSLIVYYVGAQGYKYPIVSGNIQKARTLKIEYDAQGKLKKITDIE